MSTKITEIGKAECKIIRDAMQVALDLVAEDFGLEILAGNISYEPGKARITVTAKVPGALSEALKFEAELSGYTLDEVDGRKLVDFKPRAHKMPWIYEQNGKRYKCGSAIADKYFKTGEAKVMLMRPSAAPTQG